MHPFLDLQSPFQKVLDFCGHRNGRNLCSISLSVMLQQSQFLSLHPNDRPVCQPDGVEQIGVAIAILVFDHPSTDTMFPNDIKWVNSLASDYFPILPKKTAHLIEPDIAKKQYSTAVLKEFGSTLSSLPRRRPKARIDKELVHQLEGFLVRLYTIDQYCDIHPRSLEISQNLFIPPSDSRAIRRRLLPMPSSYFSIQN